MAITRLNLPATAVTARAPNQASTINSIMDSLKYALSGPENYLGRLQKDALGQFDAALSMARTPDELIPVPTDNPYLDLTAAAKARQEKETFLDKLVTNKLNRDVAEETLRSAKIRNPILEATDQQNFDQNEELNPIAVEQARANVNLTNAQIEEIGKSLTDSERTAMEEGIITSLAPTMAEFGRNLDVSKDYLTKWFDTREVDGELTPIPAHLRPELEKLFDSARANATELYPAQLVQGKVATATVTEQDKLLRDKQAGINIAKDYGFSSEEAYRAVSTENSGKRVLDSVDEVAEKTGFSKDTIRDDWQNANTIFVDELAQYGIKNVELPIEGFEYLMGRYGADGSWHPFSERVWESRDKKEQVKQFARDYARYQQSKSAIQEDVTRRRAGFNRLIEGNQAALVKFEEQQRRNTAAARTENLPKVSEDTLLRFSYGKEYQQKRAEILADVVKSLYDPVKTVTSPTPIGVATAIPGTVTKPVPEPSPTVEKVSSSNKVTAPRRNVSDRTGIDFTDVKEQKEVKKQINQLTTDIKRVLYLHNPNSLLSEHVIMGNLEKLGSLNGASITQDMADKLKEAGYIIPESILIDGKKNNKPSK
jgi:hypothetical protein